MSALQDLYREVILDHYRAPRNRGELASPPAIKSIGKNPVCGDELTLFLNIDGDVITDIKISGIGCSISMASASMMSVAIKGKTVKEARELIDSFKELMNVHESSLESEDKDSPPSSEEPDSNEMKLGELDALTGVVKFPIRIKCATLAFNTLGIGLDISEGTSKTTVATTE